MDFDQDADALLDYFEKFWIGEKKTRGVYESLRSIIHRNFISGTRRTTPRYAIEIWNVYDRVIRDLPRSNNSIEGWHRAFNNRVSIKHPSVTKLAQCILREQSKFELDIERIRVGQEPKPKKRIYATLDARLKRVVTTYNIESISDYLARVAANVKLSS